MGGLTRPLLITFPTTRENACKANTPTGIDFLPRELSYGNVSNAPLMARTIELTAQTRLSDLMMV